MLAKNLKGLLGLLRSHYPGGLIGEHDLRYILDQLGLMQDRVATHLDLSSHKSGQINYEHFFSSALSEAEITTSSATKCDDVSLGHPFRGVSVHHLSTDLLQQMNMKGISRSSKVYEIEPTIIRPKGHDVCCPRDHRRGAAYVDCIHGEDHAGLAQFMLSYTWGYEVIGTMVDTLDAYCKRKGINPKRAYVWICCLCINQHRVKEAVANGTTVSFQQFQKEFSSRVVGIGHILVLMAPWHAPYNLKRVWCIYEIHTASQLKSCKLEIVMPPSEIRGFMDELVAAGNLDALWTTLAKTDVERADASVQSDKDNILQLISENEGFEALNTSVVNCLQECLGDAAETEVLSALHDFTADGSVTSASQLAKTCHWVAELFLEFGRLDRAMSLLNAGLELLARFGETALESEAGAELIHCLGKVKYGSSPPDFAGARQNFEEARRRRLESSSLSTPGGADILLCLGNAKRELADLDGALESYGEALRICQEIGALEFVVGASVLSSIGALTSRCGDHSGALEIFEQAKAVFEQTHTLATPEAVALLQKIGIEEEELGSFAAASEAYNEAWHLSEHIGLSEQRLGKEVHNHIDHLHSLHVNMPSPPTRH